MLTFQSSALTSLVLRQVSECRSEHMLKSVEQVSAHYANV